MINKKSNYYLSSFFWSTFAKLLNAIFGFISVPILLGYFGKAEYGLLSIATACNGYMHIMDLGMNTGAVRFFSQWKVEENVSRINKVARTNITFYIIISIINILGLIALANWGESIFAVTHEQFERLKNCLYILAIFSTVNWVTTAFNQLLIADKQMAFTQQINCIIVLLKCILVYAVLKLEMSLSYYFFFLTLIVGLSIIPYAYKCKKDSLIDSFFPAFYWKDFKVILLFSMSIFTLSLFQVTATQSRPILLSMFADNGADVVADFRIIEVVPQLIILIGGTFGSIFLPKTSELIALKNQKDIDAFAYKWTSLTTAVVCAMCFPCMLSASEILCAYVGVQYESLSIWLQIWCFIVLIQMHATPCYSLIIAKGKTKLLVILTAFACFISMLINGCLCRYFSVGSAIIGYSVYVIILMTMYYALFYNRYLQLSTVRIVMSFLKPFLCGLITYFIILLIPEHSWHIIFTPSDRINYLLICIIKYVIWLIPFLFCLYITGIIKYYKIK